MATIDQFRSTSSTYDFSKGPKSLYYGEGDSNLFGVILNVPQTDDDDEWGGTSRIAQERVVDRISTLIKEVEDPYGTGTDGLLNRVSVFENRITKDTGEIVSFNVKDITLDGPNNRITIGSTTTLGCYDLTLGTNFKVNRGTNFYTISRLADAIKLYDDGASTRYIDLIVGTGTGAAVYRFGESGLTVSNASVTFSDITVNDLNVSNINSSGTISTASFISYNATICSNLTSEGSAIICGNLAIGGTINDSDVAAVHTLKGRLELSNTLGTQNILPKTTDVYNIGSSSFKYKDLYLKGNINNDGSINTTGNINSNGSLHANGSVNAVGMSIQTGSIGTATICGNITIEEAIIANNPLSTHNIAGIVQISNALITYNVRPNSTDVYSLGSSGFKYKDLFLSGGASIGGAINASDPLSIHNIAGIVQISNTLRTYNIVPLANSAYNIGSVSNAYDSIYLADQSLATISRITVSGGILFIDGSPV